MRIFLEKVMLDLPHVIHAELVGHLDLVERILKQLQFRALFPGSRQLMLIEGAKLHLCFSSWAGVCEAAVLNLFSTVTGPAPETNRVCLTRSSTWRLRFSIALACSRSIFQSRRVIA